MNNKFDPNNIYRQAGDVQNAAGRQMFNTDQYQEVDVNIRPNKDVSPGKFKTDPLLPGGYIAHPTTIAAMRKDLFMMGDDFIDLELKYTCQKCKNELDLQFWKFCPFCETPFPSDI